MRSLPLPIRLNPLPGECLSGYIIRLAKVNGYPSVYWITNLAGKHQHSPYLPSADFTRSLSELTGQSQAAILNMTLHRWATLLNPDGRSDALRHIAKQRYVHHKQRGIRICPRCLSDGTSWQVLWQLRMVTTCIKHQCLLVELCPSCRRPIDSTSLWNGRCQCGRSLKGAETTEVSPGSRALQAQRKIQNTLLEPEVIDDLPPRTWIASLDFYQKWFGSFRPGELTVDGLSTSDRSTRRIKLWEPIEVDHVHWTLAVEALSEGRTAFFHWCRNKLECPDERQFTSGYLRSFATLNRLLDSYPRAEFDHFHDWFREFLATSWSGGYASRFKRVELPDSEWLGLEQAAQALHCRTWAVAYLINCDQLDGRMFPLSLTGKLAGLVRRDSLQKYQTRRQDTLSLAEAAHLLGESPIILEEAYLRGEIPAHRGPITDGTLEIRFHRSDLGPIKGLELALPSHVAKPLEISKQVSMALQVAGLLAHSDDDAFDDEYVWEVRASQMVGLSLPSFRRWLSLGRFSPVFRLGATALFRRSDLTRFLPFNRCTTKQAAFILGKAHPQQVARDYIRTGRLRPVAGPGIDGGSEIFLDRRQVLDLAGRISVPVAPLQYSFAGLASITDLVSTRGAAELLGMSIGAFQRAYRSTDLLLPAKHVSKTGEHLFSRKTVEEMARQRNR